MSIEQSNKILASDITTSLENKQDKLSYTPIKSVNGTAADAAGNVTISTAPSTVKGVIGSAVASNDTSLALPSGGTWFVWNTYGYEDSGFGNNAVYRYGTSTNASTSAGYGYNPQFTASGGTYSGGTTVYARRLDWDSDTNTAYSNVGKLVAVRIS